MYFVISFRRLRWWNQYNADSEVGWITGTQLTYRLLHRQIHHYITRGVWLTVISMDYMDMDLGKEEQGDTEDSAYMVMDIHKSREMNGGMDYMEMEINTIGNISQESLLGNIQQTNRH